MPTYTISDLAKAHGLTLRALRFYETKGLLNPTRTKPKVGERGGREYSENDKLRLELILRGIHFGFSLRKIGEYLEDGRNGPWLAIPPEEARKQVVRLDGRVSELQRAAMMLRAISAGGPAGAFFPGGGLTAAPGVKKLAPLARS